MDPFDRDQANLEAFLRPDTEEVAGLKLRPFTAGSLALLRQTRNELLYPTGISEQKLPSGEVTVTAAPAQPEFAVLAFLYLQGAPLQEVRATAFDEVRFRNAVLEFGDRFSIEQLGRATSEIKRIMSAAQPARVETVAKPGDGDSQETPPPN